MKAKEIKNALTTHKLSIARDKNTSSKDFRNVVKDLATILCYEALKDIETKNVEIETPIEKMNTNVIEENNFVFIPILRAGMGMLEGALSVIPNARVGHIGMYRNEETAEPVDYYFKVPNNIENKTVIFLDPMLATGGSGTDAINKIKSKGIKKIIFLSILAAPEGIEKMEEENPDVQIYCACIDKKLNEKKYIVPGLGDAGDRIYGTND